MKQLLAIAALAVVAGMSAATDPLAGEPEGERIALWPEGKVPSIEEHQYNAPFIEWFVPSNKTTDAVMIVTCGGGYGICNWVPKGSMGGDFRDWLLAKGMTVVRLHHRTPRPKKVKKHVTAWQDAQRAVRLVRTGAAAHGVNPERIGFCGYSAAGHLALLMALSSQTKAYEPVDGIDALPCNINFAVSAYPAYVLSDGENGANAHGGDRAEDEILPEFKFDSGTCPVFFMHGDADGISPMGSVKVYSRLHAMRVPCDVHVFAKRVHDFKSKGATKGKFLAWRPILWDWLVQMGFCRDVAAAAVRTGCLGTSGAHQGAWRYRWPAIVPEVVERSFEPTRRIVLDEGLSVSVGCGENEKAVAEWVAGKMEAWFGKRPRVRGEVRRVEGNAPYQGDEAYELSAKDGVLRISANTMQGVKWALMTLRQIAQPVRGTLKTTGYEVPEFTVRDRPETAFRALHLCAFPEVSPVRIERGIRMAAYYKFNHVILESWGVFRSERHPWYGYADGWLTVAECRRLAELARDLGVTIIPFFNVFGHARAARGKAGRHAAIDVSPEYQPLFEPRAGFNWCLSNPEARRVIREIVTELHAAFGKPPYFHLGCDEADPPTCAACCGADYGKLLASHVQDLASHVRSLGARPMIWHDKLILSGDPRWKGFEANGSHATVALLDVLPKDVIICDWCYYPPPKDGRYPTLDHFRSKGFTTMTCPWDDVGGIHSQCAYARRNGLGVIGTTWNHFVAYSVWSIYTHTAACAWSAKGADSVRAVEKEYSSALRDVFDTHWRQVGWDTPGAGRYPESGFFTDQVGTSIGDR